MMSYDYRQQMLVQREQLMENIDCIVDEMFYEMYGRDCDESMYSARRDELVTKLCDSVCETIDP